MLSRLETMVLMGMDLPLAAIQRQIASGVDIIIIWGGFGTRAGRFWKWRRCWDMRKERSGWRHYTGLRRRERKMAGFRAAGKSVMNLLAGTSCWRQDMTRKEWIWIGGKAALITAVTAWLYYRNPWAVLFLTPLWAWHFRMMAESSLQEKEEEFAKQFKEAIQTLSSALNTGYSVENAFRETRKELQLIYPEEARISRELQMIVRQLRMQVPVEQALEEFADRAALEDLRSFAAVFASARKSGGDLIAIIRDTSARLETRSTSEERLIRSLQGKAV